MLSAAENVHVAIINYGFVGHCSETNDVLDFVLEEITDSIAADVAESVRIGPDDLTNTKGINHYSESISPDSATLNGISDVSHVIDNTIDQSLGDFVKSFRVLDNRHSFKMVSGLNENSQYVIAYGDECKDIGYGQWNLTLLANPSPRIFRRFFFLSSDSILVLCQMLNKFESKLFLLHGAQTISRYAFLKLYIKEENKRKRHFPSVSISYAPPDANVVSSSTMYIIKHKNGSLQRLKVQIASHSKEASLKILLKLEFIMFSPTGICSLLVFATLVYWPLSNADLKEVFLQAGHADHDVQVRSPYNFREERYFWFLTFAAYDFLNANTEFQIQILIWFWPYYFVVWHMFQNLYT